MKYVPLREFDVVTSALNFDTADCHIIGGCDLYTTKAAGSDKKLYRAVENALETQEQTLLQLSATLPPAQREQLELSRASPFGPLSLRSSRLTFAYLIATLNATHTDYDFSHVLRPWDFRRISSVGSVVAKIDRALYNLRPKSAGRLLAIPERNWQRQQVPPGAVIPGGGHYWGPRMWELIDSEMDLASCTAFKYAPEEDFFDEEEGAIWSMHYFFYNKKQKRVCYIYICALSVLSHSPVRLMAPAARRKQSSSNEGKRASPFNISGQGASKRARYWLGDRADSGHVDANTDEDDDDVVIEDPGDDEVDADPQFDIREDRYRRGSDSDGYEDEDDSDEDEDEDDDMDMSEQEKNSVRGVSEGIAETMDI